jgi:hypothetical protein
MKIIPQIATDMAPNEIAQHLKTIKQKEFDCAGSGSYVCSETLSLLKASLGNLKKNGFKVVYEKHVFVWEK